jgi:hypothetical protein
VRRRDCGRRITWTDFRRGRKLLEPRRPGLEVGVAVVVRERSSPASASRSQAPALRPWKRTNAVSVVTTLSGGCELSNPDGTSTHT